MIEDKKFYYTIGLFVLWVVIISLLSGCGTTKKCPQDRGWKFGLENINNEEVEASSQKIENYGKVL